MLHKYILTYHITTFTSFSRIRLVQSFFFFFFFFFFFLIVRFTGDFLKKALSGGRNKKTWFDETKLFSNKKTCKKNAMQYFSPKFEGQGDKMKIKIEMLILFFRRGQNHRVGSAVNLKKCGLSLEMSWLT